MRPPSLQTDPRDVLVTGSRRSTPVLQITMGWSFAEDLTANPTGHHTSAHSNRKVTSSSSEKQSLHSAMRTRSFCKSPSPLFLSLSFRGYPWRKVASLGRESPRWASNASSSEDKYSYLKRFTSPKGGRIIIFLSTPYRCVGFNWRRFQVSQAFFLPTHLLPSMFGTTSLTLGIGALPSGFQALGHWISSLSSSLIQNSNSLIPRTRFRNSQFIWISEFLDKSIWN